MRTFSLSVCLLAAVAARADEPAAKPGPTADGFRLPNGWTITPVGRQVALTDLPLNIVALADGKHALVASSGYNPHELVLVDLESARVISKVVVKQSWFGLATDPKQQRVWWSGGGAGMLHAFDLADGKLQRTGPADAKAGDPAHFRSGLALSRDGVTLFSLDINNAAIRAVNVKDGTEGRPVAVGKRPYDVVQAKNGNRLYVSDWAGQAVYALDPVTLRTVAKIPVGEHPNQIVLHLKDDRLFVACASSNCVSVIDTKRGLVTETIVTGLFPRAPEGSTPDALALAPDGDTLYVANADNNCVAVIDVEKPGQSQVKGFIPTGWYPTAVAVTPDGKSLLVGVGKGNQTRPNPTYANQAQADTGNAALPAGAKPRPFPYIGTTLSGALSIVPIPDEKKLGEYTAAAYRNCPYADKLLTAAPYDRPTAIPTKVGDGSPIKHVIYVIKENRTYDQVFGDVKKGNGDPSLVMFGEAVTPNHHKLAEEFVLLDNLYCNGHVSRDGHPWSTMAYNTDYMARDWALTYSKRKGVDDDDEGSLQNAPSGYLWDAAARAGLSYRNYGEYGKRVSTGDGGAKMEGRVPGLVGHMCPDYGVKTKGRKVRDTDNVEVFLKEFRQFEKDGTLPSLMILSLGEDHTTGTTPDTFTPQACVASNDLALGRLVDAVAHSKSWPETAIFVIEDDAQNGPDHVDAHRTVGLVISPYTQRHHVDGTQYATVSMIRTIELILGLPPLSQYDAAARPMFESFTDKPDLAPYQHVPVRIDLDARNTKLAYGADRSMKMDFSEYDRVDDWELNEILWRAVKGADAPIPPAVRNAIAFRSQGALGK